MSQDDIRAAMFRELLDRMERMLDRLEAAVDQVEEVEEPLPGPVPTDDDD